MKRREEESHLVEVPHGFCGSSFETRHSTHSWCPAPWDLSWETQGPQWGDPDTPRAGSGKEGTFEPFKGVNVVTDERGRADAGPPPSRAAENEHPRAYVTGGLLQASLDPGAQTGRSGLDLPDGLSPFSGRRGAPPWRSAGSHASFRPAYTAASRSSKSQTASPRRLPRSQKLLFLFRSCNNDCRLVGPCGACAAPACPVLFYLGCRRRPRFPDGASDALLYQTGCWLRAGTGAAQPCSGRAQLGARPR